MKKAMVICMTLLSCVAAMMNAQPAYFKWALQHGGSGTDPAFDITADNQGNVITIGGYVGTVDFDNGPGTATLTTQSTTARDPYIIKVDSSSNFLWVKTLLSSGGSEVNAVTHDASGNIYICGSFMGLFDADPGPGTYTLYSSGTSQDVFVTKWSPTGNMIWARQLGGTQYEYARNISVDNFGNVYTIGNYQGIGDFDPGSSSYTLAAKGGYDFFISKLDGSGNFVWAAGFGGKGGFNAEIPREIVIHPSGGILVVGHFSDTCDFDPGPAISNLIGFQGNNATFLLHLTAAGNFVWAKQLVSFSGSSAGNCVAIDLSGDIYCIGIYLGGTGTIDFDPGPGTYTLTASSPSNSDSFVLKLDSNGNFIWAKSYGGTGADYPRTIAIDPAQNIYVGGLAGVGILDLDPGPGQVTHTVGLTSFSYILELSSQGNYIWSHTFGAGVLSLNRLYIDAQTNMYVCGEFNNVVDFDPGTTSNTLQATATTLFINPGYLDDAFTLKLGLSCSANVPVDITPISSKNICLGDATVLSASGTGTISWYNTPTSSLVLASGSNYTVSPTSIGTETFFAGATTCLPSQTRAAIILTVNACTSIEERYGNVGPRIFPSPAMNYISIDSGSDLVISKVVLYTITGSLIASFSFSQSSGKINIVEWSNGFYLLTMHFQNGESCTKKIIVQNSD